MPKIVILNDQHLFSGISTHIYKIYGNFKNHNINVEFYQFLISNHQPEIPIVSIKYGFLHSFNDRSKLIYNVKLGVNFMTGTNWRSFRNINSDITLLSGPSLLPLVKHNDRTIVIGHDLYFLDHKDDSIFLRLYMKRMYGHFKEAPLIVVDSNFTKMEFINKLNLDEHKMYVVYPYVDKETFHPGNSNVRKTLKLSDDDILLLSVGGDNPNKNIETVLRVMALLPHNYKLIRVGRNFNTASIIKEMNLSERVIALGNVDEKLLAELYRGADIFLFPSLYEGFGIPLIEAMASGIPFITSNRASLPEVAGDAGIICDPFDLECILSAIQQISRDENFKKNMIRKGLDRAKDFSAEEQFQSLQRAIKFFDL